MYRKKYKKFFFQNQTEIGQSDWFFFSRAKISPGRILKEKVSLRRQEGGAWHTWDLLTNRERLGNTWIAGNFVPMLK